MTPEQEIAQMYQGLHQAGIGLKVAFAIAAIYGFLEILRLLRAPAENAGVRIPLWPAGVVLLALAAVFSLPDWHEYADDNRVIYGIMHASAVDADGTYELIRGAYDSCKSEEAENKALESKAESWELLGDDGQAAVLRNTETHDPRCPVPSPLPD